MFEDVRKFHEKFGRQYDGPPRILSTEEVAFRLGFLEEELEELRKAVNDQDLAEIADALVDLVWVALGTAERCGLAFNRHWAEVRAANMRKVPVAHSGESKRGSALDIKKPPGWRGPEHEAILSATEGRWHRQQAEKEAQLSLLLSPE